ncbi:MAG TPA: hypothetical protein VFH88_05210 [Candidatus Krumholzibacteria bacterium]|nr:hypothetical protein [Candidatus Krumholzibacteria bacterium]
MARAAWILTCLLLAAGPSHAGTRTVSTLDGLAPGTRVRMQGTIAVHGDTPLVVLVLRLKDTGEVTLKPHSPDLEQELRNLDGLRVVVEGAVLPRLDPEIPRLEVDHYDMLAPPGAGDPIIGIVSTENDACIVTAGDGKRYWIAGDLAPALCDHDGARVWMVGKKSKSGHGAQPRGTTAFTPTGYGVLNPAPAR